MVGTVAAVVGLIGLGRRRATGVAPPPGPSGAGRRLMQPER
jgi:hypothetical protein